MDEATTRAMIKDFFDTRIDDVVRSSEIYADDAVLEFPQGKERIRGKANIIAFRSAYPARVTIELHRTIGRQDLWVSEFTILYYGEPWEPPAWRAQWVEPMEDLAQRAASLKFVVALRRRPRSRLRWEIRAVAMAAATGTPESAAWSGRRRPEARWSGVQ